MAKQSFVTIIELERSGQDVFNALTRDVAKWWGGDDFEGGSTKLNDEFTIIHTDLHYSKQQVVEIIPDQKVAWLVTDSTLNWLEKDKHEWTNTKIIFRIITNSGATRLEFIHEGLVPEMECYARCAQGWDTVIKDWLFNFITKGKTIHT